MRGQKKPVKIDKVNSEWSMLNRLMLIEVCFIINISTKIKDNITLRHKNKSCF